MAGQRGYREHGRGIALIVAMLAILVLSVLAASIIYVTQSQTWTALNYRLTTQCRYGAEAGLQQTMNWLLNTYVPPSIPFSSSYDISKSPVQYNGQAVVLSAVSGVASNYPDAAQQAAFQNALSNQPAIGIANETFSTYATLLTMRAMTPIFTNTPVAIQTWQITSQASISGVRNAFVQVVAKFEKSTPAVFSYSLLATANTCGSLSLSDGSLTDSYNSGLGAYPAGRQASNGNVETNGNLNLSDNGTTINGSLSDPNGNSTGACPDSLTISGWAVVTQGILGLSLPVSEPNPPAPSPAPPTTAQALPASCLGVTGCSVVISPIELALAPGGYGNVSVGTVTQGTQIDLTAGQYNFNSLVLIGASTISITTGPVILNLAGTGVPTALDLSGGSIANNFPPNNFLITYAGNDVIILSGGSASAALVYAPNSPINFTGTSHWLGAIIGSTITASGNHIHYDRALANSPQTVGTYHPISFSWSKF
jgi:hypothetical protein